jgi:hypothetical protein
MIRASIRLFLLISFLIPFNAYAKKHKTDFYNNPKLLANDFDEYKGIKLSIKDKKTIDKECSQLMNRNAELYKQCRESYYNTALSFKVDASLCQKKASRLGKAVKQKQLLLVDEKGEVKTFFIRDNKFIQEEQYEKCMDKAGWKDSVEFRYGKY